MATTKPRRGPGGYPTPTHMTEDRQIRELEHELADALRILWRFSLNYAPSVQLQVKKIAELLNINLDEEPKA